MFYERLSFLKKLGLMIFSLLFCFFSIAVGQDLSFSTEERVWIEQNKDSLVVALDPNFPPFEFLNERGEYDGLSIDYLQKIEEATGIRFIYDFYPNWHSIVEATQQGKIDIWGLAAPCCERAEYLVFSDPIISFQAVLITQRNISGKFSLDNLEGKRIGLVENYIWHEM